MNTGLTIVTLGDLTIQHNGEFITDFTYRKAEALLVYLAIERGSAHRRESLYTLLWPAMPEKSARNNLRQVLYDLRHTIPQVAALDGDVPIPLLLTDRQTIQIHPEAKIDIDVHNLDALITSTKQHAHTDLATCSRCRTALEETISLYQGEFLESFYLPDSNPFEEWAEARRESYRQKKLDTLNNLATIFIQLQDYSEACHHIEAQLAIDNLRETAHRQMMELLVLSGQRVEAIRQYHELVRILDEELSVAPSKETTQLYERIQSEDFAPQPAQAGVIPLDSESHKKDSFGDLFQDHYLIESKLGQGGMGSVYRAHDKVLDRDVAIKVLSSTDLGEEGRARLLNEARIVAKLNHANIITVYDVGEAEFAYLPGVEHLEGITPYIVMEYVEGINLYQRPPVQIENIVQIAQQICAALEHAHTHGIIHRDLKPENIMITPDSTVKLMDFGLARSLASRLTAEGKIIGTVFYMAPEQALGGRIDHRADLYSLGVMLYELTTGELPFQADDSMAVISQHLHAPVVPPRTRNDQIPPALEVLILQLLSKNPDERPGSAREILERLQDPEMLDVQALSVEEHSLLDRIVRGRMVGRIEELQQARCIWAQAACGAGQILLISGEPGVGKSRLTSEIVTQVEVGGGQAFIGENQAEGNAPYAAFAQIAKRALRAYPSDGLEIPNLVMAELIAIAPGLQVDYPKIHPNPPLEANSERHRLLDCFYRFITILSQKKPLLLVLEDLHWADSGTLGLLQYLGQRTREMPVMLLGTYREVELDQALPFHETLLNLNRRNLGTRLKLERLDQNQTREMLAVLFAEKITPEFLAGIYKETEGNPFFIEEVCKALVESGQVYFDGERWQRPPDMAEMEIPQSIKIAVQSRLSKLSQADQEILLTAAVIGREFDYLTLQQVTGKDEDALIDGLEAALKAQLIEEHREEKDEIFGFSHALIPATLQDGLSGLRRKRKHRQIAKVIEALQPGAYQRLAYHWSEAGDEEKGVEYTIKAADQARKTYANEDAIHLYSEALVLLPEDDERRFDLLAARAAVYDMTAQREAQLADIQAMLVLAERGEEQTRQVDALLAMTKFYIETDLSKGREPAERALDIAKQLNDTKQEARASYILAKQIGLGAVPIKARQYTEKAITLARESKSNRLLTEYLCFMVLILRVLDEKTTIMDVAQEAKILSKEFDDKYLEAIVTHRLAVAYATQKKDIQALSLLETALRMAQEIGDIEAELRTMYSLARMMVRMNRYAKAENIYREIFHLTDTHTSILRSHAIDGILDLYIKMGEYERFYRLSKNLMRQARQSQSKYWILRSDGAYSFACSLLGKYKESLKIIETSLHYIEKSLDQDVRAEYFSSLGIYAADVGDFDLAYSYLRNAQQQCIGLEETPEIGWVLINSAHVALVHGKPDSNITGLKQINQGILIQEKYFKKAAWSAFCLQAGLHLALLEEDPSHSTQALNSLEKALHLFDTEQVSYVIGQTPEHIYFLASRVYRANNHPEEADDYLHQAYERVMLVAGKIQDDDLRRSYLENVPDNRQILKEAKERGIAKE